MSSHYSKPEISRYVDRFGVLLGITVVALVVQALVNMRASWLAAELVQTSIVIVLLIALRASGVRRSRRIVVEWLLVAGIVVSVAFAVISQEWPTALGSMQEHPVNPLAMLAAMVAPILIMRRVMRHTVVTQATILGAIASYLLIAMAFALAFLAVDAYAPGAFFGIEQPTTTFFYFSLVTIATLGYGDYTAADKLGHLLSAGEAVLGQVFLVTVVAFVVGRLASQRPGDDA